ncbi:helix-turn-helix domain-containing protein [Pseudonocardia asaccharolytica]|uniref:Transcriptional regulator n=1 Tax=Pseudonocardia asaccharolytica DSM 44247 = NBRC 16224 TaxID=1123024 RepID=A0A511CY28_9PSEU|nr:XRE family transcriptional regulator [Pseudonocardia asaccharolytica]GEL17367.1 transcriptional regulator [Pseudonocardia asaccharolytica DSM 44247 = NBRC 16224]
MSETENGVGRALEMIIAHQVRGYRRALGVSITELARQTGISKAMLSKIENAQTSCSLSTLSRLATAFEVPVTSLLRGVDTEHEAVYVPAGHGAQIVRRGSNVGHLYHQLGTLRGQHKRIEPLLVTLSEATEVFPLFEHPGTEFLYMLEGSMVYLHRGARYKMRPGDALQFDGEGSHGPIELIELPVRFLSVIAYGHLRTE